MGVKQGNQSREMRIEFGLERSLKKICCEERSVSEERSVQCCNLEPR